MAIVLLSQNGGTQLQAICSRTCHIPSRHAIRHRRGRGYWCPWSVARLVHLPPSARPFEDCHRRRWSVVVSGTCTVALSLPFNWNPLLWFILNWVMKIVLLIGSQLLWLSLQSTIGRCLREWPSNRFKIIGCHRCLWFVCSKLYALCGCFLQLLQSTKLV